MKYGPFLFAFCFALTQAQAQVDKDFFYGGVPKTNGAISDFHITVITNIAYVIGYDETRKDPVWVAYKLRKKDPAFKLPRPSIGYPMDDKTISKVPDSAYSQNPPDILIGKKAWDHGHMAANNAIACAYGKDAQFATFKMSNMCPQSHRLNGGKWKVLEAREYRYSRQFGEIWTICGPIFSKHIRTLKFDIEVPSAYYKILVRVVNGKPEALAITFEWLPPANDNALVYLKNHLTTIRDVENATGLNFFSALPAAVENSLETTKPAALW